MLIGKKIRKRSSKSGLVPVMAATLSYFLLVLPCSKQVQGPAKEGGHSEVESAWMRRGSPLVCSVMKNLLKHLNILLVIFSQYFCE